MFFTFLIILPLKLHLVVFLATLEMGDLIPPKPWFETYPFIGYVIIALTIVVTTIILKKLKE